MPQSSLREVEEEHGMGAEGEVVSLSLLKNGIMIFLDFVRGESVTLSELLHILESVCLLLNLSLPIVLSAVDFLRGEEGGECIESGHMEGDSGGVEVGEGGIVGVGASRGVVGCSESCCCCKEDGESG
jgi:hypothetical protein